MGKTRLALAAAEALLGSFRDGVWYAALAGLETGEDEPRLQDAVAVTIADAVGISLSRSQPPRIEAPSLLREKEALLDIP